MLLFTLSLIIAFVALGLLIYGGKSYLAENDYNFSGNESLLEAESNSNNLILKEEIRSSLKEDFKSAEWHLNQNLRALNYISQMESFYKNESLSKDNLEKQMFVKQLLRERTLDIYQDLKQHSVKNIAVQFTAVE